MIWTSLAQIIIMTFLSVCCNGGIVYKKCCGQNEIFNNFFKCSSSQQSWSFPAYLFRGNENNQGATYKYGSKPSCADHEMIVLRFSKASQFHPFKISNGSLVQIGKYQQTELDIFPSSVYCLEEVQGKHSFHVAIVCPCTDKICVRKCCPVNSVYVTEAVECRRLKLDTTGYVPVFYSDFTISDRKIKYYMLRKVPVCKDGDVLQRASEKHYLQEDGSLIVKNEDGTTDTYSNAEFCLDYFIKGPGYPSIEAISCQPSGSDEANSSVSKAIMAVCPLTAVLMGLVRRQ